MLITKQESGSGVLYTATQGNFSVTQLYSGKIEEKRRDEHFQIEAVIKYEKWLESK